MKHTKTFQILFQFRNTFSTNWIPIFAVDRHFPVTHARVDRTQFPLKPAAGTTIHSHEGCTSDQICVDMNLSDSEGFSKNENLARLFL